MTQDLERRAITAILASPVADVLPYFRTSYFLEQFTGCRSYVSWIKDYVDKAGSMPTVKVFRRENPDALTGRMHSPEPLIIVMEDLNKSLVEATAVQSAEEMSKKFSTSNMLGFTDIAKELVDSLNILQAPIEAQLLDTDDHTEQLIADIKAGKGAGNMVPSGFDPLDKELGGGFGGGRLYTLSALVHLGKTYVTTQWATHARNLGHKVLYISLEMASQDISDMSLCLRYKLNADHYIKRQQPDSSKKKGQSYEDWSLEILDYRKQLEILDTSTGKVFIQGSENGMNCASNIGALAREQQVEAIYIDAAQDIQPNSSMRDRTAGLYVAIKELGNLATSLNIPIICTVQLAAEVEKKGLINNLANIQWGQVFAQKSHAVISMVGDRTSSTRDCTIDKNRAGVCGAKFDVHMVFPEVEVYATDLQASGVLLNADEVFEDIDDANFLKSIKPMTPQTPRVLTPKLVVKDIDEVVDTKGIDGDEVDDSSSYQKRISERLLKRTKNAYKRKIRK